MGMTKATRWGAGAACVIGLAVPAVALAAAKSYPLPHPKREHCRHGYTRRVEHHKTSCVRSPSPTKAATVTTIYVNRMIESHYFSVNGTVGLMGGHDLVGAPITFKLENASTGQILTTFTWPSDANFPCAIGIDIEPPVQTFTGEAVGQDAACFSGSFSAPSGQFVWLVGSYAGSGSDGGSTSEGAGL